MFPALWTSAGQTSVCLKVPDGTLLMASRPSLTLFLVLVLLSKVSQCRKNKCDTCTSLVESIKKVRSP